MRLIIAIAFVFACIPAFSQKKAKANNTQFIEAACGLCQYHMESEACKLAVKIDNNTYWVEGSKLMDHGDPHVAGGLCQTVRKAQVKGKLVDNTFKVTKFKLMPIEAQKVKSVQKKVTG
jgi:hypothetical protein